MRKKSYFHVLFLMLFLLPMAGISQIMQGGTPLSFEMGEKSISLNVPMIVMPEIDIEALRAEDAVLDNHKDIPWRFGENLEVDIDLKSSGIKEDVLDGTLWRTAIVSPGAVSINLLFDNFQIPQGATLYIYNEERTDVIGAFTDLNNRDDRMFATVPIRGSHIVLEYFEPDKAQFSGDLHLTRVTHGYRGPHDYAKAFGNSGACNVNVVCPASAGMEDQIRSSAMLVSGGNGFCSGALINNTSNDGTPYFLSADHCYSNPSSVIYWFNWQSATCSNPATSPSYQSISGATNRARYATSDVWLVELSSTPPAGYNVYYSGWNRTMDNNITGKIWGIHHPSGDIKKISWSTLGASTTTYLQNPVPGNGSHWRVTQWSDGTTTEGGSSGSPLYDPQGRIIGQLHGGYASCSSLTSDWYGKLGVSWTGGGTNATRLSNWLDPTSTGVTVLDGYDPNTPSVALDAQLLQIIVPADGYCSAGNITPEVVIRNAGTTTLTSATVSYTLNGGSPVTQAWTGSLATGSQANVTFPQITIPEGSHSFVATVTAPNGGTDQNTSNDQLSKTFDVFSFTVPYFENFETSSVGCWTIEYVTGTTPWYLGNGGINGNPAAAYSGTNNLIFYINNFTSPVSRAVTPMLNMSSVTNATLTFYHAMADWAGDLDELRVLYKNDPAGSWTPLQTYSANTTAWTLRTVSLPNPTATYWVAFEGTANYGYGVCVDDVLIDGQISVGLNENHIGVSMYPNPATDAITVSMQGENDSFDVITITDAAGKLIYSQNAKGYRSVTIDTSKFAKGMYVVSVTTESGRFVEKLILQ